MDTPTANRAKEIAKNNLEILLGFQKKSPCPEVHTRSINALRETINRLENRKPRK